MAKERIIPVVERMIEFKENDFVTNDYITDVSDDLITDEQLEEFASDSLTLICDEDIYRFADEYPIVHYRCMEDIFMQPCEHLNAFVESVTVSIAMNGKSYSIATGKMVEQLADTTVVAYFTDNVGRNNSIVVYDIIRFLFKKPNLVVSSDGMLVFYTDKDILVTNDMLHYAWVHDVLDSDEDDVIESIEAFDGYCQVRIARETEPADDAYIYDKNLEFEIDMLDTGMITPICETIS